MRRLYCAWFFSLIAGGMACPIGALAKEPMVGRFAIADVAEKVTPAVVNITTRRNQSIGGGANEHFAPEGRRLPQMGAGSGVIISASGDIVTNNHVIDGAQEIRVTLADRREFVASVVGFDSASDLAFLRISAKKLPFVRMGNSSELRLGEFVLAVGNPFGFGQTVTLGIVSAKGRAEVGIVDYEDFIQTDAAINPGNSGGALVNLDGELVGINTAVLSRSGGAQGIGFAVPSNMVKPIRAQITRFGKVRRGWLGVSIQDITPELAQSLAINAASGVLIGDVFAGSPADRAHLAAGDVVVGINNERIATSAQLRNQIALIEPGTTARMSVIRDGHPTTVRIRLGEKDGQAFYSQPSPSHILDGLTTQKLNPVLRRTRKLGRKIQGVYVTRVTPGSPAFRAGLRTGDVITAAGPKPVRTPTALRKAVPAAGTELRLRVYSGGKRRRVLLRK